MSVKVGINGFGRIGRTFVRVVEQTQADVEIVAVNDLTDGPTLAHLLKYDSVQGVWPQEVKIAEGSISIGRQAFKIFSERDPAALPWRELGVQVAVESTGRFTDRAGASKHLEAGAQKVLISAPGRDEDITIVLGVNDADYDASRDNIVSNASCTTNCLAPVVKVLLDNFGVEQGFMTTVHAYTNDQRILDLPHQDLRRARAAALSIIPTSTGAARAIGLVLPEMRGKMDGLAVRVPVPDGSLIDLVVTLEREATIEEINESMKVAADGPLAGVLEYTRDPIVSSDIVGNPHSAIFDSLATMTAGRQAKVLAWYDNEWGFTSRMVELVGRLV